MSKTCFVVCPISYEGSPVRNRSDAVLKHFIVPICEALDYEVIRVDNIDATDKIDSTIISHLKSSDLVIADITDFNPNVFFELGFRTAIERPLIQIALDGTDIPFDIATTRTIFYALNDLDKAEQVKEKLKATIETVQQQQQQLNLLSQGKQSDGDNSSVLAGIVKMLYRLQDSVDGLYGAVQCANNETLSTVLKSSLDAVKDSQAADPQITMINSLIQAIFQNPEKFERIMQIGKQIDQ